MPFVGRGGGVKSIAACLYVNACKCLWHQNVFRFPQNIHWAIAVSSIYKILKIEIESI